MHISLENIGKKFRNEWIFRNINTTFESGESYAFVGRNGSGKSTLLQIISSILPANEGKVSYQNQGKSIEAENIYTKINFAAPYLELVEEFTLQESLDFHRKFKQIPDNKTFLQILELEKHAHKPIKFFSSGMKQRLKLGWALYSSGSIVILDEPTSNLDENGIRWYLEHIQKTMVNKILLIGSNQPREYEFCSKILAVHQYKP